MKDRTFLWVCRIYAAIGWGAILGVVAWRSPETLMIFVLTALGLGLVVATAFAMDGGE